MPTMPSANTYASTLAIAEKACDLILGRASAGTPMREEMVQRKVSEPVS
jgi:choline dehydrogenase-like flavoprotein